MATAHHTGFDFRVILPLAGTVELPPPSPSGAEIAEENNADFKRARRDSFSSDVVGKILEWKIVNERTSCDALLTRLRAVSDRINSVAVSLRKLTAQGVVASGKIRTMSDHLTTIKLALADARAGIEVAREFPHVGNTESHSAVPRIYLLARVFLDRQDYRFGENDFKEFVIEVQKHVSLYVSEVWNLKPFLEFALLEAIGEENPVTESLDSNPPAKTDSTAETEPDSLLKLVGTLQTICDLDWESTFESVCETERVLRRDPLGAYEKMDWESRESYRAAVATFAERANCSEAQVAQKAVELAVEAQRRSYSNERARERRSHVGYYLVDAGRNELKKIIGYRPSPLEAVRERILKWSDFFYLIGIEVVTLALIALLLSVLHVRFYGVIAIVLFLVPAVGCAVAIMNVLSTRLFQPERLPKLDFSKGIPEECSTVVVVPALLASEEQTRLAVQALEIRFLANRDPNLHFVLLTDPPDSTQQFDDKDKLAALCSNLVDELNHKYDPHNKGSLLHFHRNRTYNASEELWMGWERKRGKLLEFNRYLLNQGDGFAVKTGNLSVLAKKIRYVITLDLDTQLPPAVAHRLVGTIAHPLNRAVFNRATNTVSEGYGILQPRVDISIRSASRSRLASLLSGDTGFDLYTRAVSDVYQDLFGEAIFAGKGIYEVETYQNALEHRFPCNAILSHDLIEGVYARTGLVSDVEVVDDYPSHYSAFSRRTHRWIRGDWQILFALLPRIRNFYGQIVRNPLSHISRWKIIDNLRRSVTEFASFLVLIYGWCFRPEDAAYWTLAAIGLIFFPTYFQFGLSILTAGAAAFSAQFWKNTFTDLRGSQSRIFLRLTFLLQQTLVEIDAVVRTLIRMKLTHRRLLEWETAAEAELGSDRSIVDSYLKYMLPISLAIGILIYSLQPTSLPVALPFLILWACSRWICEWLNRPQRPLEANFSQKDRAEIRQMALLTWRFFREFSTPAENWLIPDIVKEAPPLVAHRISPTNLGLLLNARLAALDLGVYTLPEFIRDTERTFEAISRMAKCRGHLYNWYATDTLKPVEPLFVSSVDSGNLLCSLWTLKQGCLQAMKQPFLPTSLLQGIRDHAELLNLIVSRSCGVGEIRAAAQELSRHTAALSASEWHQIEQLENIKLDGTIILDKLSKCDGAEEAEWWAQELINRLTHPLKLIDDFAPWLLPEFAFHRLMLGNLEHCTADKLSLESLPQVYQETLMRLKTGAAESTPADSLVSSAQQLALALEASIRLSQGMIRRLGALASSAQSLAEQMDFSFLFDQNKKMISIGYEKAAEKISPYHYDLLASEARAGVFAAIAKHELPLESWFRLRRSYRKYKGEFVLQSWTGTAFEYLMPALWFRAYPETLLDRSSRAAIRAQQKFARENRIPWGISESSCIQQNPDGHYRYHAFGVPSLAVHHDDCSGDLVIAPYATFLALPFDTKKALINLKWMKQLGWLSRYGFYEAADFTPRRVASGMSHKVVRNWMAHHQAMSLIAVANLFCGSAMQHRFHAEPAVAAVERLLNERYPREIPIQDVAAEVPESDSTLAAMAQRMLMHPEFRSLHPKLS